MRHGRCLLYDIALFPFHRQIAVSYMTCAWIRSRQARTMTWANLLQIATILLNKLHILTPRSSVAKQSGIYIFAPQAEYTLIV